MKKPLIIFGAGDIAELALTYFQQDSAYEPVACCVDRAYIKNSTFCGLPVVAFEEVEASYSPASHAFFVAVSYAKLNELRKEKYLAAKAKGYPMASYISSRATILNDEKIGENCFILEDNTIQPFVSVGHNVTLWSGNHIGHHAVIGDHCFITSHVVVSGGVTIGEQSFIGVNACLRDHITIGPRCVIGMGAVIAHDAEAEGIYTAPEAVRSPVPSSKLKKI